MAYDFDDIFTVPTSGEEAEVGPGSTELSQIASYVEQVQALQASVILWQEKIAQAGDDIKTLLEKTIPDAMTEVGMADIGLADGTRVKVEPFHRGAITEKTKPAAHKWLEDNGFGGLIKHDFGVSFGREEEGVAGLRAYVREMGLTYKEKETVHPQTLGAFIRDQASKGNPVPSDIFNIYSGSTTKLIRS